MNALLPQRPQSHQLASLSETFLRRHVPEAWTFGTETQDYGVDYKLGIARDGVLTGAEIVIQLKASEREASPGSVRAKLSAATFHYLENLLQIVLIVKYVHDEGEAYWALLRDLQRPRANAGSVTLHLPRENRVSALNWQALAEQVRDISGHKLEAGRRYR
jgi:hypothetical protein